MKCRISDCKNEAEYNYQYYSYPEYCKRHKNNQMIYKNENICVIL